MRGYLKRKQAIIVLISGLAFTAVVYADGLGCRLSGGGVGMDDGNTYQFGGEAGAHTALQPQPSGEWTHHQQRGPAGSFVFHTGTGSAPPGSEIVEIRCSDPGSCTPSGNPPSLTRQVDFDCVGTFKNIGRGGQATIVPTGLIAGANVIPEELGSQTFNGTFHFCEVNVDDNGEGQDLAEGNTNACPSDGFGEKGDENFANCDCPDFYRITIYNGVDAAAVTFLPNGLVDPASLNTTDVIYQVKGYLKNGNGLQIHGLTGFDML